ncbi:MAG TPA: flagellin [Rhizomicrobium sp.]|jgi:flagellar hook-associated protein 3 FlgL|nr:flagellin [Rhizomicrobium sp.]
MTVDRIATNTQAQYMLNQINSANVALNLSQQQVSSGKVASDYAGYGDKVALMEAARSAGARVDAYQAATKQALTQADLQNTQISALSDLGQQLRTALTDAVGQNNGSTLMTEADSVFQAASQILNAKDANGKYIYGGENNDQPPFTATSLADLASMPDVASAFQNGTIKNSVRIGDGETVQVGQLASDLGSGLIGTLKAVAQYQNANGNFGETLTTEQSTFLSGQITAAKTVTDQLNNATAANGFVYNRLQDASDNQDTMSTLYQGFVSDIQDVDMPTAITKLNQNQVALQAALQVTSRLQQVSLLNYMS